MKTAYELAMERLNRNAPSVKLTAEQKEKLAELDSKFAARIAEREISLTDEINKALTANDAEKAAQLRLQLAADRKNLQADLEDRKERVRQGKD